MSKIDQVTNDLFEFLMDRPYFEGTLQELADAVGHTRQEVAAARSRTRSAEWISEYKWEIGYVGVGTNKARWQICDLSNPDNSERSLMTRWPEVSEDLRRIEANATLKTEGVKDAEGLRRAVAEQQTAKAMVALADTFTR